MSASGGMARFPGPVDVKDDQKDKRHNKDYCSIYLEVPGLKVSGLFGGAKPSNATVTVDYQRTSVNAKIVVNERSGETTLYQYIKSLPEDIDPDRSYWKAEKETIILQLCKAHRGSWDEHTNYFIRPGN